MRYNPALTGLRAAAILPVIAYHCKVPLFIGGFYGVDIFFVLSGFLITSLLVAEYEAAGSIDLPRFYISRFLRLTPPLLVCLGVVFAIGLEGPLKVLVAGFYLTDVVAPFSSHPYGALVHTWSLAVEEHYYFIWPVVLVAVLRTRDPLRWVMILFAMATAWRLLTMPFVPGTMTYFRFDARLSGLLLGSAVALAGNRIEISPLTPRLSIYVLIVAMVSQLVYSQQAFIVFTAVELAAAGLLLACLQPQTPVYKALSHPWLVKIGLWSYGLYLWHYPITFWVRQDCPWPVTLLLTLALGFPLAIASHHFIEMPIQQFRKRRLSPVQSAHGGARQRAPLQVPLPSRSAPE